MTSTLPTASFLAHPTDPAPSAREPSPGELAPAETPLYLYRAPEGILLVHPDRHGQHPLVHGTGGFLYAFEPTLALATGLTVEALERSALPTWAPTATAPVLDTLTMAPPPDACMRSPIKDIKRNGPRKLSPITLSNNASVTSESLSYKGDMPALLIRISTFPNAS